MEINLLEAAKFMIANGYILPDGKDKFKISSLFFRHYKTATRTLPVQFGPHPTIIENWETKYKQFIIDAKVPARQEAKIGSYQCNGFSEKACQVFKELIVTGKSYEILVSSTLLYYKSSIRFKVAIGRYMEEGLWKGHYDALASAAESGTVKEHIKKEIDDGESSSYDLG